MSCIHIFLQCCRNLLNAWQKRLGGNILLLSVKHFKTNTLQTTCHGYMYYYVLGKWENVWTFLPSYSPSYLNIHLFHASNITIHHITPHLTASNVVTWLTVPQFMLNCHVNVVSWKSEALGQFSPKISLQTLFNLHFSILWLCTFSYYFHCTYWMSYKLLKHMM